MNTWAERITAAWRSSLSGIFEVGRLLSEAKVALPHGEWLEMIENDLPFKPSTAQRLMIVTRDSRLTNTAHAQLLPHSWMTLYELTKLSDNAFAARIADDTIHPEMQRGDITRIVKSERRNQRERDLAAKIIALPDKKYGVIYADPEWRFEVRSEKGQDRAAANHYPTSSTEVIAARDVASIAADDCSLWLWATAPLLPAALEVMARWGFTYKTHLVWHKLRPGAGRGTGYWWTGEHELLLLGTRGNVPAPATALCGSVITAPVGAHSEKPVAVAELIERAFPTIPKIELNRRGHPRPGWDAWGEEVT